MATVAKEDIAISKAMPDIADLVRDAIKGVSGQETGFALFVFNAEPGSRMNYISNCNRNEVARALIDLIHSWYEGMPDVPSHKLN